jgi:hypothetical protein
MACEYEHTIHPTDAANVALIRSKYTKNPKRANTLITTVELARKQTYSAKWWRNGEKERYDETYPVWGHTRTRAFDGNVVRELGRSGTRTNAGLRKLSSSFFRNTVRHQPFALVFDLFEEPFFEVIGNGRDYKSESIKVGGESSLRLFVHHRSKPFGLNCLIDSTGRLVEWSYLSDDSSFDRPIKHHTCLLLDYKGCADPSGEIIWFPQKVQFRYFDVAKKDDPSIQWGAETITFRDVRFNIDIPDSQFVIDLPADAEIYDDVTGRGTLPAGTPLPAWTNPPQMNRSSTWSWQWIAGGVVLALCLLSLLVILLRRWRHASPSG